MNNMAVGIAGSLLIHILLFGFIPCEKNTDKKAEFFLERSLASVEVSIVEHIEKEESADKPEKVFKKIIKNEVKDNSGIPERKGLERKVKKYSKKNKTEKKACQKNTADKRSVSLKKGALIKAKPVADKSEPPVYPQIARVRGYEGRVLLRVSVSYKGRVLGVELIESSGFKVLDKAAVRAVRKWKFKPALKDGKTVPSVVEIPVTFKLDWKF